MRSSPLCALLWRILTWYTRNQVTQSPTHSRPVFQEVFQAICSRWHWLQIDLLNLRFNAVDALSLPWEDLDTYTFPPAAILGKVVEKFPMQNNNSDCSGVAQHALALGPSDHVQSDPTEPALLAQPVNTALQSDPSQKSDNLNLHA